MILTKEIRILTEEEVKNLGGNYLNQQWGLLDTERDSLFLTADHLGECEECLQRMTPAHPRYKHMEIVKLKQ